MLSLLHKPLKAVGTFRASPRSSSLVMNVSHFFAKLLIFTTHIGLFQTLWKRLLVLLFVG